eukprot:5689755-Prymnesium_polylepis.1
MQWSSGAVSRLNPGVPDGSVSGPSDMSHTTWAHNMGGASSHNICPFMVHRITYASSPHSIRSSNGVIMAGIRANTAWYACNEEVCGSPVRSAVFS